MSTTNSFPHRERSIGRRHEDHLRARLAAIVTSAADAIIGATLDGIITDWNPAAERLFGYAPAEATGQPLTLLIASEELATVEAILAQARRGARVNGLETVCRTKDGRSLEVALTVSPVWDHTGTLIAISAIIREITERKRVEAALRESEARYRALVEQIPAITYIEDLQADPATAARYVSPQIEPLLGYTPEEWLADSGPWDRVVHPDDRARVLTEDARTKATGEPFRAEYREITRDGREIWVRDEAVLVRDGEGRPLYWQGVLFDVTREKAAEEALTASEARFRTAFDHAPIGMALVSLDGHILQANAALVTISGYTAGELVGMSLQAHLHPEDVVPSLELMRGVLAGERESAELETRQFRKDGTLRWAQLSLSLVRDAVGTPGYLIAQVQDVTERRRLTQDLRASEAKYRTLVELLPALVYTVAASDVQTPLYVSPYLEKLTGYLPEEVVGRTDSWLDAIHPEDQARVATENARVLATNDLLRIEYRYRRRDGSYVWVLDRSVPVHDEHGALVEFSGVLLDISDRVAAEAALAESLAAAEEATRSKSLFLAMMSHELRTPLQAILGYADFLLTGRGGPLTPDQAEDVGYIHAGAVRMIALIDQMLDLSRLEAGRLALMREPVDLADLLRRVRQDVVPQAASKQLALDLELCPALPAVMVDPDRLYQILLNLVGNAVKFTDRGGVSITACADGDEVTVAVSDTGVGIAPEMVSMIFEEFHQGGGGTGRRAGGAGLGLAIARRLADQMGGAIRVESTPQVGSTFTLRLPSAPGDDA